MRQLLVFPNALYIDISDKPLKQNVNTIYDAGWVLDKDLAAKEWVIYAKLNQVINNEDTVMIYLEEAHISKNFRL